jgi:hypothetical protein
LRQEAIEGKAEVVDECVVDGVDTAFANAPTTVIGLGAQISELLRSVLAQLMDGLDAQITENLVEVWRKPKFVYILSTRPFLHSFSSREGATRLGHIDLR